MERYQAKLGGVKAHLHNLWHFGVMCFGTWGNAIASLTWLLLFSVLIIPLVQWGVLRAMWYGSVEQCHQDGACWVYISKNGFQLMYGLYPKTEIWRINTLLLAIGLQLLLIWQVKRQSVRMVLGAFLIVLMPPLTYTIAIGGVWGLVFVPPQYWGGLALNLLFSTLSIACALPLGLLLAIARKSRWGVYSTIAKVIIDCIRGLPLVSILFFGGLILPFLFHYQSSEKIIRLFVVFTVFGAAYMAEAIRAGLQSVGPGQHEAAEVLGFSKTKAAIFIIIPQALEIALPSLMNLVIALLKDSTLLSTIAVLDIVGMMQATTARVEWMPYAVEAYVMVGLVFWLLCYGLSLVSYAIEKRIKISR